ncbi:MAG: DUF3570 domain-containing protein [Pseudomonadota bacterium]
MVAIRTTVALLLIVWAHSALGVILPEERADAMYHRYDGGGVTVDGPALLVRKNFRETVSVNASYYVDSVSSASIDVVTSGASEYSEQRTEYGLGAAYLYGKSIFDAGATYSDESDYEASTYYFNISQDFFGDLTNLSFGYALGQDDVFQNKNPEFMGSIDRHNYRVNLSQILTPNLIMAVNYELITEEGYLNNPYRSYRYLTDPTDPGAGYQLAQEVYPETRTSDAAALRLLYHLPWQAAVGGHYRFFTDDWGVDANTIQLSYTQVFKDRWTVDTKYRYYQQSSADFYSDLFTFASQDENDWRARDKELSEFTNHTLSLYITYSRALSYRMVEKSSISLQWDHIWFDYDDFRDLRVQGDVPGQEPLYDFEADVFKLVFTLWY